jgi:hypothetical protein
MALPFRDRIWQMQIYQNIRNHFVLHLIPGESDTSLAGFLPVSKVINKKIKKWSKVGESGDFLFTLAVYM